MTSPFNELEYSNLVKFPKALLSNQQISGIYRDLTVFPREFIVESAVKKDPKCIKCYKESTNNNKGIIEPRIFMVQPK